MVKVICLLLALAHVSHFAEPEPWAYKQSTHFFKLFEILQLPALLLSLPPRVALFSERAPWAHKQSTRFTLFFSPNDLRCGFRKQKDPSPAPLRLLSSFFLMGSGVGRWSTSQKITVCHTVSQALS